MDNREALEALAIVSSQCQLSVDVTDDESQRVFYELCETIRKALEAQPETVDLWEMKLNPRVMGNMMSDRDIGQILEHNDKARHWNDCIADIMKQHKGKVIL